MSQNPDLVAGDSDGTPKAGVDHLVNGRVPGQGSGLFEESAEGVVAPINDKPVRVPELPVSYQLSTDGQTVMAVSHIPAGADIEGADVDTVLKEVIINQLPPQGTAKEAAGKITLKRGEYPGLLSDVPMAMNCFIEGEFRSNYTENLTGAPATEPPTVLSHSGRAFINPDVDSDHVPFFGLRSLQLDGQDNAGNVIEASTTRANRVDYLFIEDIHFIDDDRPILLEHFDGNIYINRNTFTNHGSQAILIKDGDVSGPDRVYITRNTVYTNKSVADPRIDVRTPGSWVKRNYVVGHGGGGPAIEYSGRGGNILQNIIKADATGMNGINLRAAELTCKGNAVRANDNGAATGISVGQVGTDDCDVMGNTVEPFPGTAADFDYGIFVGVDPVRTRFKENTIRTGSTTGLHVYDDDAVLRDNQVTTSRDIGGARVRRNGTIHLSSAPTGSNYGADDAGIEILDTSLSPPDLYWVATDGTLLGPK